MILTSLEEYENLENDTVFTFFCKNCNKEFIKKKRRGSRGKNFKFLCQKCGRENTNIERYGASNVFASSEIKDKIKASNMERYDVDNPSKCPEIIKKAQQTNIAKYGVTCTLHNDDIKEKARETLLERYGVDHPMKSPEIYNKAKESRNMHIEAIKEKTKKTMIERYGVTYPYQCYDIQTKGKKKYIYEHFQFDSSWELAYYIWLVDNNVSFEYHPNIYFEFIYNDTAHRYYPDFIVNGVLQEIKGLQFFEGKDDTKKMICPYDSSKNELYEAKHQCMIKNNVEVITDCTEYLQYVRNKYTKDYLNLFSTKLEFPYLNEDLSDKSDMGLIHHFHKSVYEATRKGKLSPLKAWEDKDIIKKVAINRLKYKGSCRPQDILQGFNVTRVANKVSVFKPKLAEDIINKYCHTDSIFDPFSGFSGRLLGAYNAGKVYIGQDINIDHVRESNEIIKYKNIENKASVRVQDLFTDSTQILENYTLFTCPPYGGKEHWNKNNDEVEKTCDEWVDICLEKYKCKEYIFVVDETTKYKNFIVDTIENKSHFGKNTEYIIFFEAS